jgi:hypothetical protein
VGRNSGYFYQSRGLDPFPLRAWSENMPPPGRKLNARYFYQLERRDSFPKFYSISVLYDVIILSLLGLLTDHRGLSTDYGIDGSDLQLLSSPMRHLSYVHRHFESINKDAKRDLDGSNGR